MSKKIKTGSILVKALMEVTKSKSKSDLSKRVRKTVKTIDDWENKDISKTVLKTAFNSFHNRFDGYEFIEFINKQNKTKTDSDVAKYFGIKPPSLKNWKDNGIGFQTIKTIIEKHHSEQKNSLIAPIIELYPINKSESRNKSDKKILDVKNDAQKSIKIELEKYNGIYSLYDSQGKILYIGKTNGSTTNLWKEINNAYNRNRNEHQTIFKVKHPAKKKYSNSDANRKIEYLPVRLHDIASYFSAYRIDEDLIDVVEGFAIRLMPNNVLNKRMEKSKK